MDKDVPVVVIVPSSCPPARVKVDPVTQRVDYYLELEGGIVLVKGPSNSFCDFAAARYAQSRQQWRNTHY